MIENIISNKQKLYKIMLIILGILIVVSISVSFIFIFNSNKSSSNNSNNSVNNGNNNQDKENNSNNNNNDNDNQDKENNDILKENEYIFYLKGNTELVITIGDEYKEEGFIAKDLNGNDLTKNVSIKSNLDTSKIGDYKIVYSLKNSELETIELVRKIHVIKNDSNSISLMLNGDEVVYLPVGYSYEEQGATAYSNNKNISNEIKINSNINTNQVGVYNVIYTINQDNITKNVSRKVIVFDLNNLISYNNSKTNSNVKISINTNNYFKHVTLPNKVVSKEQIINYEVTSNGDYTFVFSDSNGKNYTKTITINNIDKVAPNGTCKAILLDGKTTFKVTSNDTDIIKYNYNNQYSNTTGSITVDKYIRSSNVILEDSAGNKRSIACQTEIQALPVIAPKSGETVKYSAKSDTLVVKVTSNNGYYLTRIWAKDPVYQMKKQLVTTNEYKRPKAILETAISKYNLTNKIVIGGNASAPIDTKSYYTAIAKTNPVYNFKEPSSLLVYNGKVIINDYDAYLANTVIYYLDGSNQLNYIPKLKSKTAAERKTIFQNAIDSGVYNTFVFNAVLVANSKAQTVKINNDYYALRQGFCQVDTNNFILVTSDTKKWYIQDFANFMKSIGCKTAVNFDGGGSVALLYKKKGTNTINVLTGNQRSLSSVMYFTE